MCTRVDLRAGAVKQYVVRLVSAVCIDENQPTGKFAQDGYKFVFSARCDSTGIVMKGVEYTTVGGNPVSTCACMSAVIMGVHHTTIRYGVSQPDVL